jgi:ABC-2 type transport system ATP-binding protein
MESQNTPLLTITDLSKSYRSREGTVKALSGLNLKVRRGEILGLLGPNGAGKTTAVKMIMGFLRPSDGMITHEAVPLTHAAPRPFIGYLPENFSPNPRLTVSEYVRLQCMLGDGRKKVCRRETENLLAQVEMSHVPNRLISNLSKGMGQRVGLAQAMAGDPDLLILDEPTSGLDPLGKSMVIDLLLEKKRQGTTIFFCSHILSEVQQLCDRIGILVGGKLRFLGTVQAFQDKWQTDLLETAFKKEATCELS